jgi:hypothetical protein
MRSYSMLRTFRAYVPYILNGRVWKWQFLAEKEQYACEMPVRVYRTKYDWAAQYVRVVFERMHRTYIDEEHQFIRETYYRCDNDRIYFDKAGIPCLKG